VILLMLALLVISSLAASLVPVDPSRLRETTTTTTTANEPKRTGDGLVRRTVDAGAKRTSTISVPLGDSLELTVTSPTPGLVEVEGLGETDFADPAAPARFDLLPYRIGTYPVRFGLDRRPVTRVEVEAPSARAKRS
jgi:hypothetical protein